MRVKNCTAADLTIIARENSNETFMSSDSELKKKQEVIVIILEILHALELILKVEVNCNLHRIQIDVTSLK